MKKKVTLARALKEKNRVAGRLAKLRKLLKDENSHNKRVPRGIDVKATYEESKELARRLVETKTAIAIANQPIIGKIIEHDEVKSEIAYLNGMDTKEGVFVEGDYSMKFEIEYDAAFGRSEVLSMVRSLQKRADEIQDALDEFNASMKVEIEVDE